MLMLRFLNVAQPLCELLILVSLILWLHFPKCPALL